MHLRALRCDLRRKVERERERERGKRGHEDNGRINFALAFVQANKYEGEARGAEGNRGVELDGNLT